jgi:GDP-L-galactose phosphorylase
MYVSRVPTVLSLSQLEHDSVEYEKKVGLATPEAPVIDVTGAYLPVYNYCKATVFQSKRVRSFGDLQNVPDIDDFVRADLLSASDGSSSDQDDHSSAGDVPSIGPISPSSGMPMSTFDGVLTTEWDGRAAQGLFRYDVTVCDSKLLEGKWGFISQCNEGRGAKKRATEYRIDQVVQDFDKSKFNFTKALQKEVLFAFDISAQNAKKDKYDLKPVRDNPSLIFINVSPIEYGHVLLVPRVLDFLPQQATPDTVLMALAMVKASDNPYFRAGFNSLGAYGTINHLHFQAYYLHAPFPIERAVTAPLPLSSRKRERQSVNISRLVDYPVRALVYEAGDCLEELASIVGKACMRLAAANQPHNLIIADRGARVFLIPQCFAERQATGQIRQDILDTQVNPAAFEIAGHLPLKHRPDYDSIDERFAVDLLAAACLTEDKFLEVVELAHKE